MNWDNLLPWRDSEASASKDSTYEEKVIERCDHEFTESKEQNGETIPDFAEAYVEDGMVVIPVRETFIEYCEKCEELRIDKNWRYNRITHKLALEPSFTLDPDRSVSEAKVKTNVGLSERVMYVNESHDAEYDTTD